MALEGAHDDAEASLFARFASLYSAWSAEVERAASVHGTPLDARMKGVARAVGVSHPERIHIRIVEEIPFPWHDCELTEMGKQLGLVGDGIRGNAQVFGYAVLSVPEYARSVEKMAHEFVHVMQVEREGSFEAFVRRYLTEVRAFGYRRAPLEVEAYAANERFADGQLPAER
ncbi:MAG: hypothetical protein JJU00_10680 [Opitutales bacterium]|nr:hypothetical protein [Opitutales bacterium]